MGYPAPGYVGYAQEQRTNGLAIASLVCSLLGISLVGVILGHIAMGQIKQSGEGGAGLAKAGLIIGYLVMVLAIVGTILYFVFIVWLVSQDPTYTNNY